MKKQHDLSMDNCFYDEEIEKETIEKKDKITIRAERKLLKLQSGPSSTASPDS